jgi:DNA modification methylase
MAFNDKPKRIIIEPAEHQRSVFGDILKLAVLNRQSKEDFIYDKLRDITLESDNAELLSKRWVIWEELVSEMKREGFTLNRTTVWKYRNEGVFDGMIFENNSNTLYDLDKFIEFYKAN